MVPLDRPDLRAAACVAAAKDGRRQYQEGVYREYLQARPLKLQTFDRRLDAILPVLPGPERVLDVGCASGAFVEAARRRGFDAWGAEAVATAVDAAPPEVRPFLMVRDVERDSIDGRFDLITFFDVYRAHARSSQVHRSRPRTAESGGCGCADVSGSGALPQETDGRPVAPLPAFPALPPVRPPGPAHVPAGEGFEVLVERSVGKVLGYEYLAGQLQANNPVLSGAMRLAGRLLPKSMRTRPVEIGIGEMLAIARLR